MTEHEWIHLTAEQLSADLALVRAIERFQAPAGRAGDAATAWLKERALKETSHVATYVLLVEGEVAGFYSLGMSEVELRSQHRKGISASHPRQGAVLILWLARAANASVDAAIILRHAVGIAQIGSRRVGAAVLAVDPSTLRLRNTGGSTSASEHRSPSERMPMASNEAGSGCRSFPKPRQAA